MVRGLSYFGSSTLESTLQEVYRSDLLPADAQILLLTDDANFDLVDDNAPKPILQHDVVIVHLGGIVPRGYSDFLGDQLMRKHHAAISMDIDHALSTLRRWQNETSQSNANHLRANQKIAHTDGASNSSYRDSHDIKNRIVVDGYQFSLELCQEHMPIHKEIGDDAILARMAIRMLPFDGKENLDTLHKIAKQHSIVTTYSSMIVLVDDEQRQRLKQLEEQEDRFDRETENGNELAGPGPLVSGSPEPEEWLLLVLVGASMIWLYVNKGKRHAYPDTLRY